MELTLTNEEFELFRRYIYQKVGIALSSHKSALVQGRLGKRVSQLGLGSFRAYYDYLQKDRSGEELAYFVSAISTNVTSFFREPAQWVWLEKHFSELFLKKRDKKIRIWSAGCSSGEEPYSLAIFLHKHLPSPSTWDIKILATDISRKVLRKAIDGIYREKEVADLSPEIIKFGFQQIKKQDEILFQVRDELRERVMFRLYNLVSDPFIFGPQHKFDLVFCRNVMIYFDNVTRHQVLQRFARVLNPGGYLFLGSSETITTSREHFELVGSSIYRRV
ncbi:MAG: protein-glutamate O-methyltransferase CheR [Campylobacterales bacterium]